MKITLEPIGVEMTDALEAFMQQKFGVLDKLVKHFEKNGDAPIRIELSRSTKHHKKGEIYCVSADLQLSGKVIRGEGSGENIPTAAIAARDIIRLEIEKHKEKLSTGRKRTAGRK